MSLMAILQRAATLARFLSVLCAFAAFAPSMAMAQQCSMQGALGLDFDIVDGHGAAAVSTGLKVQCTPNYDGTGASFYYQLCIYVNPGDLSTPQGPRRMFKNQPPNAYLNYDIFIDPAHTVRVGGVGSGQPLRKGVVVPPGNASIVPVEFYGLVTPAQAVPPGFYEEQGVHGVLHYRYSTTSFQASDDCLTGGMGGSTTGIFHSSGIHANVADACWIVVDDLDFGRVEPPTHALDETTNIRINCAPGTVWAVGLNNGQNFDGTMRQMAGTNGHVKYQLYLDASRTHVWQDDINANRATGTIGAYGTTAPLVIYGQVPPQPDVRVGTYSDTVIATFRY